MPGPEDLSPREAVNRWLDSISVDSSPATVSGYRYRLKLFVEWCEDQNIESVSDLSGWDLESYEAHRRGEDITPLTLMNEMITLKNFLEYCERVEIVAEGLAAKVHVPDVDRAEQSSDVRLTTRAARALLEHYRDSQLVGTRGHVLLELAWHTGARIGGLRALDVRDYYPDEQYVHFRHRPETGTNLKNSIQGERPVALPAVVCAAIDHFLDVERWDVHDDAGRQPLLASRVGRPTPGTLRDWMYQATIPCLHGPCPHEKDPATCEWTDYNKASQCPSSRAPHHVRTGAITWMLNCGLPVEVVAERVNASVAVIEQHYDKADPVVEMERRRRPYIDHLDLAIDEDSDQ